MKVDGQYTYSKYPEISWHNELFETQKEALDKASESFERFLLGQLQRDGLNYKIVNVMEFNEVK